MLDETPEVHEREMTEKTGFEDWLPITEEGAEDRYAGHRLRRWGGVALSFLLGCGACALLFLWVGHSHVSKSPTAEPSSLAGGESVVDNTSNSPGSGMSQIEVDVHGDVEHPGVYTLPFDARVQDAVKAAGGYLHAVDADNVNAAGQLTDGSEVDIPGPDQPDGQTPATSSGSSGTPSGTQSESVQTNRVDLNTADLATLETLPDIGPARAAAIITYRTQHGPFARVSDVTNVSGIGQGILSRIAPYLYVASRND